MAKMVFFMRNSFGEPLQKMDGTLCEARGSTEGYHSSFPDVFEANDDDTVVMGADHADFVMCAYHYKTSVRAARPSLDAPCKRWSRMIPRARQHSMRSRVLPFANHSVWLCSEWQHPSHFRELSLARWSHRGLRQIHERHHRGLHARPAVLSKWGDGPVGCARRGLAGWPGVRGGAAYVTPTVREYAARSRTSH